MWNTFILLLHILPNVCGLVLNGVLFVIARYYSPLAIRKYSLLIINFAVCDFLACLSSLAVCQSAKVMKNLANSDLFCFVFRIIPAGKSLFYFSEGFCQYFGARFCYISYSVLLHLYAHSLYSMLLSFYFRYYVLIHRAPSGNVIKLTILFIYIPSFVQMVKIFADFHHNRALKKVSEMNASFSCSTIARFLNSIHLLPQRNTMQYNTS
ncbi:unnamed protein product [Angiostrongylus costaricensis]|uniref:G_PROTEIN_RECEP_F1_2 domain-containing protein n=1 Tax=Angiostrongylus costaricensis TaxID=334426 RepID=A0A158PMG2_ANGCS|nr:unnamed protein product [Angiostrongylus costaricensis]